MCYAAVSDLSWEIKERPDEDGNTPAPSSTLDEERRRYRLAIATGSNSLYLWCDLGASAINLSTDSLGTIRLFILCQTTVLIFVIYREVFSTQADLDNTKHDLAKRPEQVLLSLSSRVSGGRWCEY
jgi:hypothetical protein